MVQVCYNLHMISVLDHVSTGQYSFEIFGRYWHEMPVNIKKDFSKKKYLLKCGYQVEEIWDDQIKKVGISELLRPILYRHNIWHEL